MSKYRSPYAVRIAHSIKAGHTPSFANQLNAAIAKRIPFSEVCQIADVGIWQSEQKGTFLYTEINGLFRPYASDLAKVDSTIFELLQDNKMLQKRNRRADAMQHLYRVIGKKAFIDFYCPPAVPERTFRHWCDKAFRDPRGVKQRVHPHKRIVIQTLRSGANIRITERGSLYIISSERKIRISDHPTNFNSDLDLNIVLP